MKIIYKNNTVQKQFSAAYRNKWRYPENVKKKLIALENFIISASSLQDIVVNPSYRFHLLTGDRQGEWSISLGNTGYRVTVLPCDEKENVLVGGDIISKCRTIKIVMVMEVSNHYE